MLNPGVLAAMKIAVLGPGGVGGLLAAALERDGHEVVVVAQDSTAEVIASRGIARQQRQIRRAAGEPARRRDLTEPVDVLIVATKALGLEDALARIEVEPALVLPLLNGLDHLAVLRRRFASEAVLAGSIRVESDRPEPGVMVHTSPFLLVSMASPVRRRGPMRRLAEALEDAGVPSRVLDSEADVMWSKLVRLNALACTTSAYDKLLGEIRSTPELRGDLVATMEEAAAAGRAEGAGRRRGERDRGAGARARDARELDAA